MTALFGTPVQIVLTMALGFGVATLTGWPWKDAVCFASVGMLLDPAFLMDHLGKVVLLVLVVSAGKGLIFVGLSRDRGWLPAP